MQLKLNKIPNWLRWIALLPISAIFALILNIVIMFFWHLGLKQAFGEQWATILTQRISAFLLGLLFVYIGGNIAPRHKLEVAKMFGLMYVMLDVVAFVYIVFSYGLQQILMVFDFLLIFTLSLLGAIQGYKAVKNTI